MKRAPILLACCIAHASGCGLDSTTFEEDPASVTPAGSGPQGGSSGSQTAGTEGTLSSGAGSRSVVGVDADEPADMAELPDGGVWEATDASVPASDDTMATDGSTPSAGGSGTAAAGSANNEDTDSAPAGAPGSDASVVNAAGSAPQGGAAGAAAGSADVEPELACSNGVVDEAELCDDGNLEDADGCSASCQVETGWICAGTTPSRCQDIDECGDALDNCSSNATCTNESPGFSCTCVAGYVGDGVECADENECEASPYPCDVNADCTNTVGSFECHCPSTLRGNGDICTSPALEVVAGEVQTCVRLSSGEVRCWGIGQNGALGYGNEANIGDDELPGSAGRIGLGAAALQVVAGRQHSCALLQGGTVSCWGVGGDGRLGYGAPDNIGDDELPRDAGGVQVGGTVTQLSAGAEHTCALLDTGKVRCWGNGQNGKLGYGSTNHIGDDELPGSAGDLDIDEEVLQVGAGLRHTCVLLAGGAVKCWGDATYGSLGYGNTDQVTNPADVGEVALGGAAVQLSVGAVHNCVVLEDASVRCWGLGDSGALGYGNRQNVGDDELPTSVGVVQVGAPVRQVSAGTNHTCVVLESGAARCWGWADYGVLGYANSNRIGDDEFPSSAGDIDTGGTVLQISAGVYHTCALLEGAGVRCWGNGSSGLLGQGNRESIGTTETPGSLPLVVY